MHLGKYAVLDEQIKGVGVLCGPDLSRPGKKKKENDETDLGLW